MKSRSGTALIAASFALALAAIARPAAAQSWGMAAYAGYFLPTGDILAAPDVADPISQQDAMVIGGRVSMIFNGTWGAEFSLGYAGSGVEDSDDQVDGSLMLFSLRALYMFPAGDKLRLYGALGLGHILRQGDAWDEGTGLDEEEKNDYTGTLALGLRYPIGDRLRFRAELEDYLYTAKFDTGLGETEGQFQHDLVLSVGLHLTIGAD